MRLCSSTKSTSHDQSNSHDAALEYEKYQVKKLNKWIQPIQWDIIDKRNILCDICLLPITYCPSIDAMCSLCNVVSHISCLNQIKKNLSYRNSWICQYCADDIQISKDLFIQEKMKLNHHEIQNYSQICISKHWRKYFCRKKFKKIISLIIRIQKFCKKIKAKNILLEVRKSLIRSIKIEIQNCTIFSLSDQYIHQNHLYDPYVLITVCENELFQSQIYSTRTRLIRKSNHPIYSETFLLPAISGDHVIVLSVIDRGLKKDEVLGQAVINLCENSLWNRGGVLSLELQPLKYQVLVNGKNLYMKDIGSVTNPIGVIYFSLKPSSSLDQYCGWMLGPSPEKLALAFKCVRSQSDSLENSDVMIPTIPREEMLKFTKLWIVLCDHKLYIHYSNQSLCKFIVDLDKITLEILPTQFDLLKFIVKMSYLPDLIFEVIDVHNNLNWKSAFLAAYQSARENSLSISSLMNELQIKRLLPSLIKKEKVEESRVATPINNIPETPTSTRPMSSNSKYPTRPSTSSRPSTSRSRKGVQYIDKTGKIFYEENSFTEECCSTLPMVSFNLDLQPMQLLSLNSSSPEITSTIFTSMHENRVVLTSRYNFGLSMVLEPDFDSEIKINF